MKNLLLALLFLLATSFSPAARAYDVAITQAFNRPVTFSLESDYGSTALLDEVPTSNSIYFTGEIYTGAADAFAGFLKAHHPVPGTTVFLYSPGGDIHEGMAIGRLIRAYGLSTSVQRLIGFSSGITRSAILSQGECDSACTFAFMGGVRRTVPLGANYGVHDANTQSVDTPYGFEQGQSLLAEVVAYCNEMGIAPGLIDIFVKYYSIENQIYNLSPDELSSLNITTDDYATTWTVEAYFSPGKFDLVGRTPSLTNIGKSNTIVLSCDKPFGTTVNVIMPFTSAPYAPPFAASSSGLVTNAGDYVKDVQLLSEDAQGNPNGDPVELSAPDRTRPRYYLSNGYLRVIIEDLSPQLLDYIEKSDVLEFRINMNESVYWAPGYALEVGKERNQMAAAMVCPA
jgi:hypothetical protein